MGNDINLLKNDLKALRSIAEGLLERFQYENQSHINKHDEVNEQVLSRQPFGEQSERLNNELDSVENILQSSENKDMIEDAIDSMESLIEELNNF